MVIVVNVSYAQPKNDNIWLIGYSNISNDTFNLAAIEYVAIYFGSNIT